MFSRMCRSFKDQVELAQICDGTECGDRVFLRNAMTDFPGLSPEKNWVCWYVVWVFFPMRLSPKLKNFSSWMPWRDLFSVMKRMDLHCMKPSSSFYGIKPIRDTSLSLGILLFCFVLWFENWITELFPSFTWQVWQLRQIAVASVFCFLVFRICLVFLEVTLFKVFPEVELFFLISIRASMAVEGIVMHWDFNSRLV